MERQRLFSRSGGRQAALLLLAAGSITILNDYLPGSEMLNRGVLLAVGLAACAVGAIAWVLPWRQWGAAWSLMLVPVALALISVANFFGGVSAYSYAVYFVVLFVWVGTAHPAGTSAWLALPASIAYVAPFVFGGNGGVGSVSSVTVAIPVCVLVGETVARAMRWVRRSQADSERRSEMMARIAGSARSLSVLDGDGVLQGVLDAARDFGFEAGEICRFDESGAYRVSHSFGLPDEYVHGLQPAGSGLAARVREAGETIVVQDYSSLVGAVPAIRRLGFRFVVASPIRCDGSVQAALIAGRRDAQAPANHVEAFDMLTAIAGRALENVQRYDAERRAVERLAEIDRLKDDFIANVSHELRTPLTVIKGMGLTLGARWQTLTEEERADLLRALNGNAARLEALVQSLLDFARVKNGETFAPVPTSVADLTSEVVDRMRHLLAKHHLEVSVPSDAMVVADPSLLERVVENLLANAVRHTRAGTSVRVSAVVEGARVRLTVQDDGPGISAGEIAHLGERFFRGSGATAPGTGLGLALVREVLTLHQSELHVESSAGEGSRFSFYLPRVEERHAATAAGRVVARAAAAGE